jgi:hypothetical protein
VYQKHAVYQKQWILPPPSNLVHGYFLRHLTTTTTAAIQAEIAFSYENAGDGTVRIRLNVVSGTTLVGLTFSGNTTGYQSSGCIGTTVTTSFSFGLNAAASNALFTQFAPFNAVLSAQATSLSVEGNAITNVAQTITVSGSTYLITGATNCYETP